MSLKQTRIKLTIYAALAKKLGREPTHQELVAEVKRIIGEASNDR
jgi:hypothetical protein